MQVVRHTGLDITVHESNRCRPGGSLSRQGPATLRWALFEAGKSAARDSSPDYTYYQAVKRRHDGKLAAIAVARKLARVAITRSARWTPRWSTRCPRSELRAASTAGSVHTSGGLAVRSCHAHARRHPAGGLPTPTRPRSHDGGHPITIVVAGDTPFAAHPGNAGRPHAASRKPTTRPTLNGHRRHVPARALDSRPHTGNERLGTASVASPNAGTVQVATGSESPGEHRVGRLSGPVSNRGPV